MTTIATTERPKGHHAALFVFVTVLIDAMGIGIIIPVMPDLIRDLSDLPLSKAALWGGYLSFVYAFMQFLFGPTVGNLSDRFGRRPVLLVSLAVLTIDYLIMGFAPTLAILFIGACWQALPAPPTPRPMPILPTLAHRKSVPKTSVSS
ncbi:MAG: MFS transporter, partial [Hyphomicrobiaceae bacterium]